MSHALARFDCRLVLSPELLRMPREIVEHLREAGASVIETTDLYGALNTADVVYMTRIQRNVLLTKTNTPRSLVLTSFT